MTAPVESASDGVLSAEKRRIAAILSGDGAALAATLADDLTFVHTSGRRDDRAGVLAHFAKRVRFLACEQSDVTVRTNGTIALLTARTHNHLRLLATGQENRFDAWVTQVWRHDAGGWLLTAYHATRIPEN